MICTHSLLESVVCIYTSDPLYSGPLVNVFRITDIMVNFTTICKTYTNYLGHKWGWEDPSSMSLSCLTSDHVTAITITDAAVLHDNGNFVLIFWLHSIIPKFLLGTMLVYVYLYMNCLCVQGGNLTIA